MARTRAREIRPISTWVEDELRLPDGPYKGQRYELDRQPFNRLWFQAIESGAWTRYVALGPSQSGKSLVGYVMPALWHLFEVRETVICGLPDMDMAFDKWREDFLPAIEASPYRELLPRRGGGARGGAVEAVKFLNGSTLKFMSGGGGDKSRAGFTARVLVVTEVDGMDGAGTTSREADKITQLEVRTNSYGARARTYMECTVSIEKGRIWQEYTHGTASRIVLPCPHCGRYVTPEREHFVGWSEADTVLDARDMARVACPECGSVWTNEERVGANRAALLVHRGQEVTPEGEIVGAAPRTDTLGFRWNAANNLFHDLGDIGAAEWRALRDADEENAEKKMTQFFWAVPYTPPEVDTTPLEAQAIVARTPYRVAQGVVPRDAEALTLGVDVGKHLLHWVVVAWRQGAAGHVVDYGVTETHANGLGVEKGILIALREIRDLCAEGWQVEGDEESRNPWLPDQVWIDSGYQSDVVYAFCREEGRKLYRPVKGFGSSRDLRQRYARPMKTTERIRQIGEGYHYAWHRKAGVHLVEIDVDSWKWWVHERLGQPYLDEQGKPTTEGGAMTLFAPSSPNEHFALAKHLTAEKRVEEYTPGKGVAVVWRRERKNNHWLDALTYASTAGHAAGARLLDRVKKDKPSGRRRSRRTKLPLSVGEVERLYGVR